VGDQQAVKKVVNVLKNAAVSTVNTLTKVVKEAETKVNDRKCSPGIDEYHTTIGH
jgi:hypothetical protein